MIRRLRAADLEHWKAIRLAALTDAPRAFGRTLASFHRQNDDEHRARLEDSIVFAAFEGGAIVGSAAWQACEFESERHRGRVTSFFVRPEWRGRGFADALMRRVAEDAHGHVLQLELDVGTENARAIVFYRRHGFAIVGTVPRALCLEGAFVDEHVMLRRLDA